jgi:hypothetical protein
MRTTILIASLLVPLSVRAETLLVEIHQVGHEFDASSSASFNFLAFGLDPQVSWHLEHAPADVGNTFEAGPSVASNIGAHFAYPGATIEIDGLSAVGGSVDLIWSGSFPGKNGSVVPATVTTFVPRIGFGLTGYALTRVTETLDSYTLDKSNRYWIGDASQTYRLYGDVAVPEPSTSLMAICGLAWIAIYRRK